MKKFKLPADLKFNNGRIEDPESYFGESGCVSWLSLVGEEFAKMEGGLSFEQVQNVTPNAINVVSDPPLTLNLELARQHVAALDHLPRPTLVTCRTGPRASAVAYMYAGLTENADPDAVLQAAEEVHAPFTKFEEYKEWVRSSIDSLRREGKMGI